MSAKTTWWARALCLVLVAGCEIQPAPKKQPAPPPPPPAQEVAKPVEAPPADAGVAGDAGPPKLEITPACVEVGAKVAQVFIDSATDPGQKSIYEQERANMTRKTGEACTTQGWSEPARNCYLAAKTPAQIKACETKFPAPQAAAPPPPPKPASAGGAQ
ncbi:MAG TPA: hypothetical protein VIV40_34800 [Kofleriaceae bacterium]